MSAGWKYRARRMAAATLFYSGVERLRGGAPKHRVILAYHRVLPSASDSISFMQPGMYVTERTFEQHLLYFMRRYRVVSLDELVAATEGPACAITFDDGWKDNYTNAFPILRRYGVPATIFLCPSLVGSPRWPWPDRISYYLHKGSVSACQGILESGWHAETGHPSGVALRGDPFHDAEAVIARMKKLANAHLERLVERFDERFASLSARLHQSRPWMTWEEVGEMGGHGISFGSHGDSHVILTQVPRDQAESEITKSKEAISERAKNPVVAFCYPNGAHDAAVRAMVLAAGYRLAVTTKKGAVGHSDDLLQLGRVLLHEDISNTDPLLAQVMHGVRSADDR